MTIMWNIGVYLNGPLAPDIACHVVHLGGHLLGNLDNSIVIVFPLICLLLE